MQSCSLMSPELIELRIIYNFLDQNNTGELRTSDIGRISRKFEQLRKKEQPPIFSEIQKFNTEIEDPERIRRKPTRQSRSVSKRASAETTPTRMRPKPSCTRISTQSISDLQAEELAEKPPLPVNTTTSSNVNALPMSNRDLRMFPNKKQTLDFTEFQALYEECMQKFASNPEVLLECFSMFDYTQDGFLSSEKLKQAMSIFGIESSEEETKRLLKFMGCKNSIMTFSQFERIFGE